MRTDMSIELLTEYVCWRNTPVISEYTKNQLSLRQPTLLIVSDIQGHPRSTIFILSERAYDTSLAINSSLRRTSHSFRDMASIPLKNAHFSYPLSIQPRI